MQVDNKIVKNQKNAQTFTEEKSFRVKKRGHLLLHVLVVLFVDNKGQR